MARSIGGGGSEGFVPSPGLLAPAAPAIAGWTILHPHAMQGGAWRATRIVDGVRGTVEVHPAAHGPSGGVAWLMQANQALVPLGAEPLLDAGYLPDGSWWVVRDELMPFPRGRPLGIRAAIDVVKRLIAYQRKAVEVGVGPSFADGGVRFRADGSVRIDRASLPPRPDGDRAAVAAVLAASSRAVREAVGPVPSLADLERALEKARASGRVPLADVEGEEEEEDDAAEVAAAPGDARREGDGEPAFVAVGGGVQPRGSMRPLDRSRRARIVGWAVFAAAVGLAVAVVFITTNRDGALVPVGGSGASVASTPARIRATDRPAPTVAPTIPPTVRPTSRPTNGPVSASRLMSLLPASVRDRCEQSTAKDDPRLYAMDAIAAVDCGIPDGRIAEVGLVLFPDEAAARRWMMQRLEDRGVEYRDAGTCDEGVSGWRALGVGRIACWSDNERGPMAHLAWTDGEGLFGSVDARWPGIAAVYEYWDGALAGITLEP